MFCIRWNVAGMKKLSITILAVISIMAIALAVLSYTPTGKRLKAIYVPNHETKHILPPVFIQKLNLKALHAKVFAQKNKFNTGFCFLVDMSLPSWQKRFFVYDLKKDSVINSGLVTHGNCNQYWLEGRKYDN